LGNVFSIICYLIIAIIFLNDYIKDKKNYRLLVIMDIAICIFFKMPFASNINKIVQNTLVVIFLMILFAILYLLLKEIKKKSSS